MQARGSSARVGLSARSKLMEFEAELSKAAPSQTNLS